MEPIKTSRSVESIEGKRASNGTRFFGLRFKSSDHATFFLTPGQVRTVLALAEDARRIISALPKLPRGDAWRKGVLVNGTKEKTVGGRADEVSSKEDFEGDKTQTPRSDGIGNPRG